MFSRREKLLLGGLAVVTACSWCRALAVGTLKVDQSYPARSVGYALLACLVVGWATAVAGWRELLADPPARPRRVAFAALGIASLMLPMLSNDIFSVLSYGAIAAAGHDVYTTTTWLSGSPFYPLVGEQWRQTVCMYGPTALLAALPARLAGANPWIGLAILKVVWLAALAWVMDLSLRHLRDRPLFHVMVWLNPLFILEGPGQLHSDLLGLVAVTAGIVLHRAGHHRTSFALFAAALLSKYTFVTAGLWFWLSDVPAEGRRGFRLAARLATMGAILAAMAIALYAPFWVGPETLLGPLRALGHMNPGGSITEVLGTVVQFLRTGTVTPPDLDVQAALELDRTTKHVYWIVVAWISRIIFLAVTVRIAPSMLRRRANPQTIALGTGVLTVALLTLAGHRFLSWYLVSALPFFGLACTKTWKTWWIAVVAVAIPVNFACVLDRSSIVYPIWSATTTGALVVIFVAWFRARYLTLSFDPPPGVTGVGA